MSIQQSVNQALQSGIYAAGIGKGLANQKQIMQQQAKENDTQLNILKEMQKKANQNLKMTREAMKEQQKQFNIKTSGAVSVMSDPREFAKKANIESNKLSKAKFEYNKALQERRDIKSKIKDLEDK